MISALADGSVAGGHPARELIPGLSDRKSAEADWSRPTSVSRNEVNAINRLTDACRRISSKALRDLAQRTKPAQDRQGVSGSDSPLVVLSRRLSPSPSDGASALERGSFRAARATQYAGKHLALWRYSHSMVAGGFEEMS